MELLRLDRLISEARAPFRDLASAAHPETLDLLRGVPKLDDERGIFGACGEAIQQPIAFFGGKAEARALCRSFRSRNAAGQFVLKLLLEFLPLLHGRGCRTLGFFHRSASQAARHKQLSGARPLDCLIEWQTL